MYSHVSILDWFLNSNISVNGYTNVYWNGITTLQWSKLCENLINNWDTMPKINQYGTNNITPKIELLKAIKKVYNKNIEIHPKESSHYFNKCLESDLSLPSIEEQLKELKEFYNK
jgi:dTDP-4-dehydrorhamnose reductase